MMAFDALRVDTRAMPTTALPASPDATRDLAIRIARAWLPLTVFGALALLYFVVDFIRGNNAAPILLAAIATLAIVTPVGALACRRGRVVARLRGIVGNADAALLQRRRRGQPRSRTDPARRGQRRDALPADAVARLRRAAPSRADRRGGPPRCARAHRDRGTRSRAVDPRGLRADP